MFERFTDEARVAVVRAKAQARRSAHGHVGCEHLLHAVAASDTPAGQVLRDLAVTPESVATATTDLHTCADMGIDGNALAHIGIDLDTVRERVEATFGPGALSRPLRPPRRRRRWRRRACNTDRPPSGRLPFTPRAKRCLEHALREAVARRDHHVGVEHLVLALASMREGLAPRVLTRLGVAPAQLRAEIQYRYRDAG